MYEIKIEIAQIRNIKKYNTGNPKIFPEWLNIKTNGTLNRKSNVIESTTNFC